MSNEKTRYHARCAGLYDSRREQSSGTLYENGSYGKSPLMRQMLESFAQQELQHGMKLKVVKAGGAALNPA